MDRRKGGNMGEECLLGMAEHRGEFEGRVFSHVGTLRAQEIYGTSGGSGSFVLFSFLRRAWVSERKNCSPWATLQNK